MNKKVITSIVVIVLLALVALAVVYYAPSITEIMLRMHTIPQH
jgi:CHASE3 domain sensor protein